MRAKDEVMEIWLITGFLILIGCSEAAHLITIMTNESLQTYTWLCVIFTAVGVLGYIILLYFGYQKGKTNANKSKINGKACNCKVGILAFLILSAVTVYRLWSGYVPYLHDAVYEMVLGNLKSQGIMTVHPFMGKETAAEIPMRMRILGLSSFYTALITISQQSAYIIMCKVVPFAVWGLSILVYWAFGKALFPESAEKRWLFISMVALVYLITSGGNGLVGYRLFYSGFSGETIRAAVLIPYTLYVCWQKRWLLAVVAILAEACLVWTTFGIGYCLLIAVSMFLVHLVFDWRGRYAV